MTDADAESVRNFVRECLAGGLADSAADLSGMDYDFDVLLDGGIDSFGFLQLLTLIETRFGCELDLGEFDVESITLVGTLAEAVARCVR